MTLSIILVYLILIFWNVGIYVGLFRRDAAGWIVEQAMYSLAHICTGWLILWVAFNLIGAIT